MAEIITFKDHANTTVATAEIVEPDGKPALSEGEIATAIYKDQAGGIIPFEKLRDLQIVNWVSSTSKKVNSFKFDDFEAGMKIFRSATITLDLAAVKRDGGDKKESLLKPIVDYNQDTISLNIALPPDYNYHEITDQAKKAIEKKLADRCGGKETPLFKAIKLDEHATVTLGFKTEKLSDVLDRAAELPDTTADPSTGTPTSTTPTDFTLEGTEVEIPWIKKFTDRLRQIIDLMETISMLLLSTGDSDRLGSILEIDGLKKALKATLFALDMEPFRRKQAVERDKIEAEIRHKREKFAQAQEDNDPVKMAGLESDISRLNRVISIMERVEQLLNGVIEERKQAADAAIGQAGRFKETIASNAAYRARFNA